MIGIDDVALILVVTTAANLVVEVGAEIFAEWVVAKWMTDAPVDGASALGFFASDSAYLETGCISPADAAFVHFAGSADLLDQCVTMLRIVVN